jgi:hypothetical protein
MRKVSALLHAFAAASLTFSASAAEPAYTNDFQSAAIGKPPEGMMLMSGDFAVREEGGNKFVELPGAPLDTFGLLFGPSQPAGRDATARFFGTKQGRKFPAFGLSLGGVGGYRLQVSAGKKALEIFKADESRTSVPYDWPSGAWVKLRLHERKTDAGWVIEGKAWPADAQEPAEWMIKLEETAAPPAGRAAVWGSPYSGTAIRFDDLRIEAAAG